MKGGLKACHPVERLLDMREDDTKKVRVGSSRNV